MRGRARAHGVLGVAGLVGLVALAACAPGAPAGTPASGGATPLTVLIGSGGDARTQAISRAVASWSAASGTPAGVQVSSDLDQELVQRFASGHPPDVVEVDGASFAGYAARGDLLPYGDKLGAVSDIYPGLVRQFTHQGTLYCAPRDVATLALVIGTDAWNAAGLSDADLPTTWDMLAADARRLTTGGRVGLAVDGVYARLGVFLAQAGGGLVGADGVTATVDSDANVAALTYVKAHLVDGTFAYPSALGVTSGTDALGTGKAAMTIADNGVAAALAAGYPAVAYRVVPLPAGPAGPGTLEFSSCWGIAAASEHPARAIDLVKYLAGPARQTDFADAFGAMPSVQSAIASYTSSYPALAAFADSATFAQNPLTADGTAPVVADLDARLKDLATQDPRGILAAVQAELQAALAPKT